MAKTLVMPAVNRLCCIGLLILTAGCGASASSVSGTVTLDGKELDQAFITFFPEKGVASTRGADIRNGQYQVFGLTPGKKRVLITAKPAAKIHKGQVTFPESSPNPIPADIPGNNQIVDVVAGNQTLDFKLGKNKK
jgi:hypothetical protein